MLSIFIVLAVLLPVLAIGATLIELLTASAPRRGKWPYPPVRRAGRRRVRVVTRNGQMLTGTPKQVVARLRARGEVTAPDQSDADLVLCSLEAAGEILCDEPTKGQV